MAVLDDNRWLAAISADRPVEAASLNKLAIAYAAEQKGLRLDRSLVLEESDIRPGNGILRHFPLGFRLAVGDVRQLSLNISDNTAAAMLVRVMGGPLAVNNVLESEPDLLYTLLQPQDPNDTSPTARFYFGQTTAFESALLQRKLLTAGGVDAQALAHGNFVRGARAGLEAHPEQWNFPLPRLLLAAKVLKRVGRQLPDRFYDRFVDAPMRTPHSAFPNKEGNADGHLHETVQIGRFTVAMLSRNQPERATHLAHQTQAKIGSSVFRFIRAA